MHSTYDVIVIGAGIAGLTAAWTLQQQGCRVCVLESSDRVGGKLHSERIDGFLCEWGAHTFQRDARALRTLAKRVGCLHDIARAASNSRARFIVRNNALEAVPMGGPKQLLQSSLLSWSGKWAFVKEQWNRTRSPADESLGDFVRRRFGHEIAAYCADPMVSGIFGGDLDTLEVASAFPQLLAWEAEYGSLIRALQQQPAKRSASVYGFAHGMATLCHALARQLGVAIHTNVTVRDIAPAKQARYRVRIDDAAESRALHADGLVVATPAHTAAALLETLNRAIADDLRTVHYAPMAVVQLGYTLAPDVAPYGFGFLVPSAEQRSLLGCLFTSRLFPDRAPDGSQLFTVFLGGARRPELAAQPDAICIAQAHQELCALLKLPSGALRFTAIRKQLHAIPQYTIGHRARVQKIGAGLRAFPGLYLTGNYVDGTSVNATIVHAQSIAERIGAHWRTQRAQHTQTTEETATERARAAHV